MFIEERHQAILDIISDNGSITTSEIQKKFAVSYDSAKRDLRILEEKGLLRRTHGGAIRAGELSIGKPRRKNSNRVSECAFDAARRGLDYVKSAGAVFIPGGEMGYALAELLSRDSGIKSLRVITNSPRNAEMLSENVNIRVIMLGGEIKNGEAGDSFAVSMLSRFRIDTAFIEAEHYSDSFGLSCDDGARCAFLEGVIAASRSVVLFLGDGAGSGDGAISVGTDGKIIAII